MFVICATLFYMYALIYLQIADIKLTHSCEIEVNNEQHKKAIREMDEKLKAIQVQLKGN